MFVHPRWSFRASGAITAMKWEEKAKDYVVSGGARSEAVRRGGPCGRMAESTDRGM